MAEENLPEMRPIVTREEAKIQGLKRYFTGKPCLRGHIAERRVIGDGCLGCYHDPVFSCLHCGKHIDFPEAKPGAERISRPKFCSDYCRLYSKVSQEPGQGPDGNCWEYQGGKHKFGYGMINMSGTKTCDVKAAHAVAWQIANGPIPDSMFVLHKCDNPACCRPDHLFLGTHQTNMADMITKGRRGKRFTEMDVRKILNEFGTDEEIAKKYGCSTYRIWRIRTGQIWARVEVK